jgi:PEP-CTERM motif
MSASQSRVLSCVGSGLLAAAVSSGSLATPANVTPGDSNIPIPVFSGSTPTVSVLFDTGPLTDMKGGITLTLEEWAVHTSLNPGAITIAFDITTSSAATALDATLRGYGHLMTSVESCDPFQMVSVCGTTTGTVSRKSGAGEILTFNGLATNSIPPPPGGSSVNVTNLYGIFTDASGFTKNSPVTIKDGKTTFSFTGIAPTGTASVPEPATFGLLSLGLLGSLLGWRRRGSPGQALLRL